MKKAESNIVLTFILLFFVWLIIYSVLKKSNFFTPEVFESAMLAALVYLGYIWINTRRHRLLAYLSFICIVFMFFFEKSSYLHIINYDAFDVIRITIMFIYFMVAYLIADFQSKKLLEEDQQAST